MNEWSSRVLFSLWASSPLLLIGEVQTNVTVHARQEDKHTNLGT
jgi:hypothetical protein